MALPVNTRTVGRLNELSIELQEVAQSLFDAGFKDSAVSVLASARLALGAGSDLLDRLVAQREAMLKDDDE